MYRSFIRRNITSVAIIIFVLIFCGVQLAAPHFLYNEDGSLRQFGIGYKKKTVIPNIINTCFSFLLNFPSSFNLFLISVDEDLNFILSFLKCLMPTPKYGFSRKLVL